MALEKEPRERVDQPVAKMSLKSSRRSQRDSPRNNSRSLAVVSIFKDRSSQESSSSRPSIWVRSKRIKTSSRGTYRTFRSRDEISWTTRSIRYWQL